MSDHISARHDAGQDGAGREPAAQRTMSGLGPIRPEEGSALDLLLRRQSGRVGAGHLLGFVPAQVR